MAHYILKEIEQENFNVDNLIENLTYKATDGRVGQADFDPLVLEDIFKKTIEDLKIVNEKTKQKIEALEDNCQKEKLACTEKVARLESHYKEAFEQLNVLDKRISNVSSTMTDMGSQLENLNKPRHNLAESQKLFKYYDKFMIEMDSTGVFADESKLDQAADVINKLHQLSLDLRSYEHFETANQLIELKYNDIETQLSQKFHQAFFRSDLKLMKKYIGILSNFKGYQNCVNDFIKNAQMSLNSTKDIFQEIVPLCRRTNDMINVVFANNERIMEQFVKDLFLGRVQTYVNSNIEKLKETDTERYLDTIHLYYNRNKRIFKDLSEIMKISSESSFFKKLLNEVYNVHLKDYVNLEKTHLQNKFKMQLDRFYESIGHTKRTQTGFVSNLLSKSSQETIDDRFISHDVATLCIDDAKKSLTRVMLLCDSNQQPKAFDDIYEIVCIYLCKEHIIYALDLHITALQAIDIKQAELKLSVFSLIKQLNNLMYLFEQFSTVHVLTPISTTPLHTKVLNRHRQITSEIEAKVDACLEKAFTVICAHIKYVLQNEQKKTDFKSEVYELSNQCTPACSRAMRIIEQQIGVLNTCLDGKNISNALRELGIKFHRCIYDHLFRYEYNEMGAMALIRDINDYRLCAKNFNSPLVDKLFSVLFSLTNLLVVKPSNLQEICSGENLQMLNKDVIESFVQLRSDFKTLGKLQIRAK